MISLLYVGIHVLWVIMVNWFSNFHFPLLVFAFRIFILIYILNLLLINAVNFNLLNFLIEQNFYQLFTNNQKYFVFFWFIYCIDGLPLICNPKIVGSNPTRVFVPVGKVPNSCILTSLKCEYVVCVNTSASSEICISLFACIKLIREVDYEVGWLWHTLDYRLYTNNFNFSFKHAMICSARQLYAYFAQVISRFRTD